MPALALLVGPAFVAIVAFLSTYIGKKLAVGAALGAFLVAGWIALQVAILALWNAVAFAMPDIPALQLVTYLLPSNTNACINALILAKLGRWLWDRQREWAIALAQV